MKEIVLIVIMKKIKLLKILKYNLLEKIIKTLKNLLVNNLNKKQMK
jgi:hypothetical protein